MAKKVLSIEQQAKLANGRSHRCEKCPFLNQCTPNTSKVCSDNFVEGFIKGVKFIKKQMREN